MGFKTIGNYEDIYVTSDLHLSNIVNRTIAYRGFKTGDEHTKYLRNLINSKIKNKSAILYILGDIGFKNQDDELVHFFKSLTPIIKVSLGNHDSEKQLKKLWSMGVIQDFKHDYKISWQNELFHLNHFPILEWDGFYRNSYHCFGHTHGNMKPYLRAMDIGLDANDMQILHLSEVIEKRKDYNNIDDLGKSIKLF